MQRARERFPRASDVNVLHMQDICSMQPRPRRLTRLGRMFMDNGQTSLQKVLLAPPEALPLSPFRKDVLVSLVLEANM